MHEPLHGRVRKMQRTGQLCVLPGQTGFKFAFGASLFVTDFRSLSNLFLTKFICANHSERAVYDTRFLHLLEN
jgi:hypothetical protein